MIAAAPGVFDDLWAVVFRTARPEAGRRPGSAATRRAARRCGTPSAMRATAFTACQRRERSSLGHVEMLAHAREVRGGERPQRGGSAPGRWRGGSAPSASRISVERATSAIGSPREASNQSTTIGPRGLRMTLLGMQVAVAQPAAGLLGGHAGRAPRAAPGRRRRGAADLRDEPVALRGQRDRRDEAEQRLAAARPASRRTARCGRGRRPCAATATSPCTRSQTLATRPLDRLDAEQPRHRRAGARAASAYPPRSGSSSRPSWRRGP